MGFVTIFGIAIQDAILVVTYAQRQWADGRTLKEGARAAAEQALATRGASMMRKRCHSALAESRRRGGALTSMKRVFFPVVVALGLAGLGALAINQYRAPDRLRAGAAAAGLASVDLSIREMG